MTVVKVTALENPGLLFHSWQWKKRLSLKIGEMQSG